MGSMAGRAALWIGVLLLGCGSTHDPDRETPAPEDAGTPRSHDHAGAGGAAAGARGGTDAAPEPDAGPAGGTGGVAGADAALGDPCSIANCDPEEASCTAAQDVPICSCRPGYRDLNGDGSLCADIDECAGEARCAANADCIDTPGSYACVCAPGFQGDGTTSCQPNVVCTAETSMKLCGENAYCAEVGDDDRCVCSNGYEGDGVTCTDRDECAAGTDDCHPLAHCENQTGAFTCTCPASHVGGGRGGAGCFEPRSRLTEPRIPPISGACPAFAPGTSTISDLLGVRLYVGPKPSQPGGPLLFYWHGAGSNAEESETLLPAEMRQEIMATGGIIAAFETSRGTGGDCSGTGLFARDDFAVADQIAACAVRDHNVDPRRIYVTGCTAGGLQAGCMAIARAEYVAAVVTNSGGLVRPLPLQVPYGTPALALFSSASNPLIIDLSVTSRALTKQVAGAGGFAVECDHGGGICRMPEELHLAVWGFMKDHPFGITASPYDSGLPPSFPAYCSIQR